MSLTYKSLSQRPQTFQRIMGISVCEFELILLKLEPLWEEKAIGSYKRQGRLYNNSVREIFMMLLLYYRTYMTQFFIGHLFGIDDSNVCRNIKTLEPILAKVVGIKKNRTISKKEAENLIIDATEQEIERPKRKQQKYYSGKKKRHTVKTEIQVTVDGKIKHVSKPRPGTIHDFALHKEQPPIPDDVRLFVDSGYQGIDKIHKEVDFPYKKPKNGELDKEEKEYNRGLSSLRVKVENILGDMKLFKIFGGRYRNKRKRYGIKVNIIAGIVNIKNGFATA